MRQANRAKLVYRRPDGSIGWTSELTNGVTEEGVSWLVETGFLGIAQLPATYCGLITNAGFLSADSTDTHASHPGWSELSALDSAVRPTWQASAANGGAMGTSVPATFTFTSDGFLIGTFLSTISAVGSLAAGVLYNTAIAVDPLPYENLGTLDVSFVLRLLEP